jgi:hypothetical protein
MKWRGTVTLILLKLALIVPLQGDDTKKTINLLAGDIFTLGMRDAGCGGIFFEPTVFDVACPRTRSETFSQGGGGGSTSLALIDQPVQIP